MSSVPRPITKLSDEQQKLLTEIVRSARRTRQRHDQAEAAEEETWQMIVKARAAGIPDKLICEQTGFSRATLNRRFGKRPDNGE